jgi:succinate dehydrogenase / fumarate reductase membrane anchor subunit
MMRSTPVRPSNNFEVFAWFFMRVSGLVVIVLALYHFYWMHFVIGVENIDFNTIVGRWTGPDAMFWRLYDLLLLGFAFTHGVNGARNVMNDYISSENARAFFTAALSLLWVILMAMGMYIIFAFHPGMATPFGK